MNLSRRHFLSGTLALPALAATQPAGEKPNVLLLLVEGLPAWLLSCYGNTEVQAPNIFKLSQMSTRFLNHYACSPIADAAEASLLTGRTTMQLKAGGDATLEKLLSGIGYVCGTSANAEEANRFLEGQSKAKPFFLQANFTPFEKLPADAGQYAKAKLDTFGREPVAKNATHGKELLGAGLLETQRRIAAAVMALDAAIGTVTAKLMQKKLQEGTLIILTSPCGSLFGRHGLWGAGNSSEPLNMYEEVIATPLLVSWLGRVVPGGVRPEVVSAYDLIPTICDITPAALPDRNLCGRSYLALAAGKPLPKKQPWRTTVFAQYGDTAMARSDRYKLIVRADGRGPGELYDDKTDAREQVNQYDNPQFLTVKTELTAELSKWKRSYSA